jgi:hypothetical protein
MRGWALAFAVAPSISAAPRSLAEWPHQRQSSAFADFVSAGLLMQRAVSDAKSMIDM